MIVSVEYTAPVSVRVDTETGRILDVTVGDEHIEPTGQYFDSSFNEIPPTDPAAERAQQIVDSDVEWPAWEMGY